jgi:hypothetical protein
MRQLTIAALIVAVASSAFAVDITSCAVPTEDDPVQITVPAGETGVLQADLTGCHYAVTLGSYATLDLNNHTISDCGVIAVICFGRRCTIEGPGEVTGGSCNIDVDSSARHPTMIIRNVNVHDTTGSVGGPGVNLLAENLTVTNQVDNPNGTGSQIAVGGYRVFGTNLIITDNVGFGLWAHRRLRLSNSTITGNDGFFVGKDLYSRRPPRFENVTCGLSDGPNGPWGVCTND